MGRGPGGRNRAAPRPPRPPQPARLPAARRVPHLSRLMTDVPPRAGFGALRHRNFRLFFVGQGVSLVGTWMQNVAQGWLVLELTNSPFYVGLVSALGSLGVLLFTIYAGVVADRTNKHRLVLLTQTLSMLPAFALAALVWTRSVAVWHVAALAAFLGLVNAFDIPARQAFVVEL